MSRIEIMTGNQKSLIALALKSIKGTEKEGLMKRNVRSDK